MSIFRPYRKDPKKFTYIPRYFDPVKEEREQRRRELHGQSSETDSEEYVPGRYIRTQRDARDERRAERQRSQGRNRLTGVVILLVFVAVFIFVLYPRIMGLVNRAAEQRQTSETADSMVMELTEMGIDMSKYPDYVKNIEELEYNRQQTSATRLNIYDDDVDLTEKH
ncbi:MAG: hypothetical protein K2F95_07290 [Alistipes sp.]|nr:hypothetical protein [Alistipes sp.]